MVISRVWENVAKWPKWRARISPMPQKVKRKPLAPLPSPRRRLGERTLHKMLTMPDDKVPVVEVTGAQFDRIARDAMNGKVRKDRVRYRIVAA